MADFNWLIEVSDTAVDDSQADNPSATYTRSHIASLTPAAILTDPP